MEGPASRPLNYSVPDEFKAVAAAATAEDRPEHHVFRLTVDGTDYELHAHFADKLPDTKYDAEAVVAGLDVKDDRLDAWTREAAAFQCVLRSVAKDPNAPAHERVTAHFLSIWIGSNDIDILCVPETRPWLVDVIGAFVKKYPLTDDICRIEELREAYGGVMSTFQSGEMREVKWAVVQKESS